MKKLKWIVLAVVVIVVAAVIGVLVSIDSIVRKAVEVQATSSLDLQTTLGSANVSLLGGSLSLKDLQIASPPGFKADRMFTLAGVKVGVSLNQLRGDPIAIDQVVIDNPRLVIEQAGGKFNFQALMDRQSKQAPDSGSPGDGKRDEGEPVRLVIRDLAINDARVVLRPGIPGLDNELTVPIPSLHLKDVGSGQGNANGVAIKQVIMLAVTELAQKATEVGDLPGEVRQLLSVNVAQVAKRVQDELGKLTKELGKAIPTEAAKDAGKAIEKGLGNILKGDKESKEK